jgi:DNA ligase-1
MDSDEICVIIDLLAETKSRKEKKEILEAFLAEPEFCKVLEYTYHPQKRYYLQKLDISTVNFGDGVFTDGTWALLRELSDRELTGNVAKAAVYDHMSLLTKTSAMLLRKILLKNLRIGAEVKSINDAHRAVHQGEALLPEFPYMRCELPKNVDTSGWPWKRGVFAQVKQDGQFATVYVEGGRPTVFFTREGNELPNVNAIKTIRRELYGIPVDRRFEGEFRCYDPRDKRYLLRATSNGIMNRVLQSGTEIPEDLELHYLVWDSVPLKHVKRNLSETKYSRRFGEVQDLFSHPSGFVKPIEYKMVHSWDEAGLFFDEMLDRGEEGAVIKHPDMIWKFYTSKEQLKLKAEKDCELRVLDMLAANEDSRNAQYFGSLLCGTDDEKVIVAVSGIKDELRKEIAENWKDWEDAIVSVRFSELTKRRPDGTFSLYLPRLIERRLDKSITDSLEYFL